ncbi:beta-1,4 N-acetylgalactosaminyltransferase 2-like [Saccoglossus kowalevskii]|uniref:Beta-1,4 N-acetylgalactosaminyltransferase 2-like n=1 Tax=Saccoglossus kowalevskii TaxID=10224 RepID=A0ABM0H1K7_SACKO|nr:PREDICTED: beta-1,4 N-acetylgalactosaminyltransferase 2-like [Saccoglossus kowalevskii]
MMFYAALTHRIPMGLVKLVLSTVFMVLVIITFGRYFNPSTYEVDNTGEHGRSTARSPTAHIGKLIQNNIYEIGDIFDQDVLRKAMQIGRLRCNCPDPPEWLKPVNKRRIEEGNKWEFEKNKRLEPLSICKAMSPFNYIGGGITVEPYQTVPIIGLSLHPIVEQMLPNLNTNITLQISSTKKMGKLHLSKLINPMMLANHVISGERTFELKINLKQNIELLNTILDTNILYTSDNYELDARDQLQITLLNFTADIYVRIRREPLPDLYDPGERNSVIDKVTVITKTFERPDVIEQFVSRVHKYYPNISIIIADDSEFPKPIKKDNVKYFIMPFREGSFPGRNLALSQVRTKYVVFLDDDMYFTNETNLEIMMEKLEDPNIDMDINCGEVKNLGILKGLRKIGYNDTQGYCNLGPFFPRNNIVPGYPQCVWGEMFMFFFMAKTAVLRKIGAYPQIVQAAHEEAWIDTIGKAKSAFCSDSSVYHIHGNNKKYAEFRKETRSELSSDPLALFENNMCYWWSWYMFPDLSNFRLKVANPLR